MNRKIALVTLVLSMVTSAFTIQLAKATLLDVESTSIDGRIEITFHSIDTAQSIPFYPHTPETVGYIFAWVDLTIENIGQQDISINWNFAYLKDSNNYLYKGTHVDSPQEFPLVDLPPGETQRGKFYFEVPSGAVIEEFVWDDYSNHVIVLIPEFSTFLFLSLSIIAPLLAVIVYKRTRSLDA
jgi:hypothetical protein